MAIMMLSTVGTSVLTNVLPRDQTKRFFDLANAGESDLSPEDKAFIDEAAKNSRSALAAADRAKLKRLSAELNGVFTHEAEAGDAPERMHHVLFATDTYAGRLAAELILEWLLANGRSGEIYVAAGLRTSNLSEFRCALAEATPDISRYVDSYRDRKDEVLFNLTGGFKGVQGFMQALAMVRGVESIYVFESSSELMRIPRLPIGLTGKGVISDNFSLFERMAKGEAAPEAEARAAGIPETLLFLDGGKALLSEWGATLWSETWAEVAEGGLMEPSHPRVAFSNHFRRDAKGLPKNRLRQTNEAIASLGLWLDGADRSQGRHKIEKLTNPRDRSTHELYAWTDQDAGRIFFCLKDGAATVEELTNHPK